MRSMVRRIEPAPPTAAAAQDAPAAGSADMSTLVAGVELPNPILTASGCAASGRELQQFFDVSALGAVVTKSVMLAPRAGRPTPRMAETPSGMLNAIGLQGPGIDAFLDTDLPWLVEQGARVVVSIAGNTVEEYAELARRLQDAPGVTAVEVNISCPNVEDRGQVFACDKWAAARVLRGVRRESPPDVPVLAKLTPDVTDIVEVARSCVDAGADGLTLVNTLLGMAVDTRTMRPALAAGTGGLSGPAIRPVAVRCIWQVRAALPDATILGVGGVRTGLDALELVLAGADAVSVGTATFGDPTAPVRVLGELAEALVERGFAAYSDAVGYAHRPPDLVAAPLAPVIDGDAALAAPTTGADGHLGGEVGGEVGGEPVGAAPPVGAGT